MGVGCNPYTSLIGRRLEVYAAFWVNHHKSLALVKAVRKRQAAAQSLDALAETLS